jgi:hypothetical protein
MIGPFQQPPRSHLSKKKNHQGVRGTATARWSRRPTWIWNWNRIRNRNQCADEWWAPAPRRWTVFHVILCPTQSRLSALEISCPFLIQKERADRVRVQTPDSRHYGSACFWLCSWVVIFFLRTVYTSAKTHNISDRSRNRLGERLNNSTRRSNNLILPGLPRKTRYGLKFSPYHIAIISNILPSSQIIRHFKNLGESNDLKFDQIYMIR